MRRFLCLLLALIQVLPSLGAVAPPHGRPRPQYGTTGMGYGVTGVEHHQYLVDTSQPYAEVIQEAEWMNNALPLITRYDIGLDRLRMFRYQVTSNGPPPVYSPVLSGWYLFDGLGSTRAVVDDGGVGQSEFGYGDAFGIPYQVAANGTRASAGSGFFLNGQQWDGSGVWNSGEGLYFNRARYYQPGLGRFIGEDAYKGKDYEPETLHRYLYTINEPVDFIDPDGNETLSGMIMSVSTWMVLNQHRYSTAFAVGEFAFGLFFPDQADYLDAALQGSPSIGIAFAPAKAGRTLRKTAGILSRYQLEKYGELIIEKLMAYSDNVGSWENIGRRADASGILRANMKKAGHLMQVGFANAAHHIFPVGEKYKSKIVKEAQAILESVGIGPEHPANGVLMRTTKKGIGAPHGAKDEPNIHTEVYADYVAQRIKDFTEGLSDKEEIKARSIEALQEVGIELLQGKKIW